MPKYSLVIPVYNEESTIPELYRRVSEVMDGLDGTSELILINDGSQDRTLELLRELHALDDRVVYLGLARNFGHQIAVTAGLEYTRGDAVIVLDADLQDPPELIPEMLALWREGYDVVYAQRIERVQESWFKKLCAYGYYRILKELADVEIPTDTGDFCLMDREIVNLLNSMPERNRYIRGLRSWIGFNQTALKFKRDPRFAGDVKYTFTKSLALAINGLVSFSTVPLRLSTYLGLFSAFAAVLMEILILYCRMFTNSNLNSFVPALDLRLALYDHGLVPPRSTSINLYQWMR
jgi:polyisoprenyl-phosphate glycosyltransferase